MPRAAPPWLYAVAIREHGPDDASLKLVLHTLRAYMDDSGYCFPSMRALAKAASLNKSTVNLAVQKADELGWLAVYPKCGKGKDWKGNAYRSCIPDTEPLWPFLAKHNDLIAAHIAKHGDVSDHAVHHEMQQASKVYGQPVQQAPPRTVPAPNVSGFQPLVSGLASDGVRNNGTLVSGQSVPKSSSEVLDLSSQREGRLAPTSRVEKHDSEKTAEPNPEHLAHLNAPKLHRPVDARGLATKKIEPDPDLPRRIRGYAMNFPDLAPDALAKTFRITTTEVLAALNGSPP